jgi:hypothetical protein
VSDTLPDSAGPAGSAPLDAAPLKVTQAAADRHLGTLVMWQKGSNPFGNFFFGIACAVGLVVVGLLLAWAASATKVRALAWLTCILWVIAVIVATYSVMALLAGFTATYLYTNGLVHLRNGKTEAASWPEVDELLLWKAGGKTSIAGTLLSYRVVTFDGRKISVELASNTGDRTLGEQLQQIVRQLGRPVTDSGPYVGRMR